MSFGLERPSELDPKTAAELDQLVVAVRAQMEAEHDEEGRHLPFEAYSPEWTAVTTNPLIGNGTIEGRYIQIGKLVFFSITLAVGATTTFGSGAWIFSLPVAAKDVAMGRPVFAVYAQTNGGTPYGGFGRASTVETFRCVNTAIPGAYFDFDTPFTWAAGDFFTASGCYEAAGDP